MRRIFLFLILISFFVSICFAEILVSEAEFGEPIDILVEGAGNDSVRVISPSGEMLEIELVDGFATMELEDSGTWAIEYGEERKTVSTGERYLSEPIGFDEKNNFFVSGGIVGIAILGLILAGVAWAIYRHLDPTPNKKARLYRMGIGDELQVVFCSGSTPLEKVRIFCGDEILIIAKRLDAFESLEIKREEGDFDGRIYARFFESGDEIEVESGEETVLGDETRKEKFQEIKPDENETSAKKRKLTRL